MTISTIDSTRLQQALDAANLAIGLSEPNPRVGCVLGLADGTVFGIGYTQEAGGPHAEVMALRAAQSSGADLRGSTAWVTLEPCSHHGRTPPCCEALISAGLARVVVAVGDPNPKVAGNGLARLRAAGLTVDLAEGSIAQAARELNIGFFSRHERARPWVRLKLAMSLDGQVALNNGQSQWITGPEARADGHGWRRRAGAVLTGAGTVVSDDPRLDVRLAKTSVQPLRAVLDSTLRISTNSRILQAPGAALVFTTSRDPIQRRRLQSAGAEVQSFGEPGHAVDLSSVIKELCLREVNELHVEAGPTLSGAFIRADLVDELLAYIAPALIGPGMNAVSWSPLTDLNLASRFRFTQAEIIGSDLRVMARRLGH